MTHVDGPRAGADPAVWLTDISKHYSARAAISDATLSLARGEVLGLVGPNGAGKSTLLKIIAGLVSPTEGSGEVLGLPIGPGRHPCPFLGIMVEKPTFVEHLSGRRNLRLLASLRATIACTEIDEALRAVGLDPRDRRPVRAYSQGMRQRLSLAQAMMERPTLTLLDEPTTGLDPEGIVEMRDFVRAMADSGSAVVLASHLLAEVEAVCDRVIMVSGGRCAREFVPGATDAERRPVLLSVTHEHQIKALAGIAGVVIASQIDACTVELYCDCGVPELVRALVAVGIDVEHVGILNRSLEDMYMSEMTAARL